MGAAIVHCDLVRDMYVHVPVSVGSEWPSRARDATVAAGLRAATEDLELDDGDQADKQ